MVSLVRIQSPRPCAQKQELAMPSVRIYRPGKTAMQSGRGNTHEWVVEFEPGARWQEPLMGWTAAADTLNQVRLTFATREEAVGYAEKHGLMYTVEEPKERTIKAKAYADNFRFDRFKPWTH